MKHWCKRRAADEAEHHEPELDIPAEIERRQDRLEAAKARLEERQRQADSARGRSPDDERIPRDKDGKRRGGRLHQRHYGVPPDKAQDSFTDPQSRIMKRAGEGFDYSYNAQTAVDEAAHIIVAAELVNTSSDVQELPIVLKTVEHDAQARAQRVLADAGYRSEAVMAQLAQEHAQTELVIALGREGKRQGGRIDAQRCPQRRWPPSLRGLAKCAAELKLVCMALNLRRMATMALG